MNDIRGYLIGTIWTFQSLLVPIRDFMIAMMVLFGLNLVFGIVAAVFNGEEWSWKKFGMFFVCCAVFFRDGGCTVYHRSLLAFGC